MDITGKIIWAGQRRSGVSAQGKSWASQDFCIQNVSNGPYGTITTNVAFSIFGEDKLNQWNPQLGEEVTVGYGINAHEYQGKWFNEVRAYKYERKAQPVQQMQQGYQQPVQQSMYAQQSQQPFPQPGYQQGGYSQAPY